MYRENPKTKGSGIKCVIPHGSKCPFNCKGCFFQSGRSYLEPFVECLPNFPDVDFEANIVRVNDGNDSSHQQAMVIEKCKRFKNKYYNTSLPSKLDAFDAPVVLTINPGEITDKCFYVVKPIPAHLMYVRIRTNTWNVDSVVEQAIWYYTHENKVPVVLTFMGYETLEEIPKAHRKHYMDRVRTANTYYAITTKAWRALMRRYEDNLYVSSCGKIEGEKGKTSCRFCGVCLREYYATKERMNDG